MQCTIDFQAADLSTQYKAPQTARSLLSKRQNAFDMYAVKLSKSGNFMILLEA